MQVIYLDLPVNIKTNPSVIGLGYFDGVHKGHQKIIETVINKAKELNVKSSILTFDMPIRKLFNNKFYGEITPLNDKIEILDNLGIDILYVLRFNEEVAMLPHDEFICQILDSLNILECVCGSDYRYGFKALGTVETLNKKYKVNVVDFLNDDGKKIASSSIIELITNGQIEKANSLLGYNYKIRGQVVKGLGNGKTIGFKTANLEFNDYVKPLNGVYKVSILIENRQFTGLANVGNHPTIDSLNHDILEVYIKDFDEDIYGKNIEVSFISFIREEIKFNTTSDLIKQINIDLTK